VVTAARQVIDAETDASTGTRCRVIRRIVKAVEETHGAGVVPLPGRTTFYKLMDVLSTGRHTFGSAVTRRQTANRPAGSFTPTFAARPGEQVQIDSTPLDVMVLLDTGLPVRAELTIVVDVATRSISRRDPRTDSNRRRGALGLARFVKCRRGPAAASWLTVADDMLPVAPGEGRDYPDHRAR